MTSGLSKKMEKQNQSYYNAYDVCPHCKKGTLQIVYCDDSYLQCDICDITYLLLE